MPTRSASSFRDIFLSTIIRSKRSTIFPIPVSLQQPVYIFFKLGTVNEELGQTPNDNTQKKTRCIDTDFCCFNTGYQPNDNAHNKTNHRNRKVNCKTKFQFAKVNAWSAGFLQN